MTVIDKALAALPIAVEVQAASGERVYANPAAEATAFQKRGRETSTRHGRAVVVESAYFRVGPAEYRVSAVVDIDDERRLQDELFQRAYFDPLTKLPSRAFFEEAVARSIGGPDGDRGRFAVAMIGFDQFDSVNEFYGRKAGDALLAEAARRIGERMAATTWRRDSAAINLRCSSCNLATSRQLWGGLRCCSGAFATPFTWMASRSCCPLPPGSASILRTTSPPRR